MKLFHRRNLPHIQPEGCILFLTYRLYGSLPNSVLARLRQERELMRRHPPRPIETPRERALREGKRLFALTDSALARELQDPGGRTPRYLARPEIASIVVENLLSFHGRRFNLHRYVIRPNHVHLLLEPLPLPPPADALSNLPSVSAEGEITGLSSIELTDPSAIT